MGNEGSIGERDGKTLIHQFDGRRKEKTYEIPAFKTQKRGCLAYQLKKHSDENLQKFEILLHCGNQVKCFPEEDLRYDKSASEQARARLLWHVS